MTLPYPNSPVVDENIAESIERIKDNLDYLDGLTSSNIKAIVSNSVELSLKSGTEIISGVGFQPKAMICIATHQNDATYSWGAASQASTTTSVDCGCAAQASNYGGAGSSVYFMQFWQTSTSVLAGSISNFNSDGAVFKWTKTLTPGGKVADLLYIFFG